MVYAAKTTKIERMMHRPTHSRAEGDGISARRSCWDSRLCISISVEMTLAARWLFGGRLVVPQGLQNLIHYALVVAVDIQELIVAEEQVRVVCVREDVPTPTVQHRQLKKGRQVFCFMFEEQMAGRLL